MSGEIVDCYRSKFRRYVIDRADGNTFSHGFCISGFLLASGS